MKKILTAVLCLLLCCTAFATEEGNRPAKKENSSVIGNAAEAFYKKLQGLHLKLQRKMDERFKSWGLGISRPMFTDFHQESAFMISKEETKETLTYQVDLPFFAEQRVEVSIKNNVLIIETKKTLTEDDTKTPKQIERIKKYFSSEIMLPDTIIQKSMSTTVKDNALFVSFKKKET